MLQKFSSIAFTTILFSISFSIFASGARAGTLTREDLIAFVQEGAKYVHEVGADKAFAEFSKPGGKFHRGELYIYVYEYGKEPGTCIGRAHGLKPEIIGDVKACTITDKAGQNVNRLLMNRAKAGGGFVDFFWMHPIKKVEAKKTGYAIDLDGKYFIGSGVYFE